MPFGYKPSVAVIGRVNTPTRSLSASQACSQAGVIGAIAPSAGPIAPSGASLGTLCT